MQRDRRMFFSLRTLRTSKANENVGNAKNCQRADDSTTSAGAVIRLGVCSCSSAHGETWGILIRRRADQA